MEEDLIQIEGEEMAEQSPEMEEQPFDKEGISPDSAAASLAFFTNLSEKMMNDSQEPEQIEVESEEGMEEGMEKGMEQEMEGEEMEEDPKESMHKDMQKEIKKAVQEEMSGLKEEIKKLLDDEEEETSETSE